MADQPHICIHLGTEKTGSSALQCRLARARAVLDRQSLRFVRGAPFDEQCMMSGRISGGNALKAAEAIDQRNWDRLRFFFEKCLAETAESNASTAVISSELLLRPLSRAGNLERILKVLKECGFGKVRWLIVLRDPVGQCLSLYKHRAKGGTGGDIAEWVESGYGLPDELAGFRREAETLGIQLDVRRYDRAPGALERIFFSDWLGIDVPDVAVPAVVNPSLTLSELVLIRQVAVARPELVMSVYEALVAVEPADKVQGQTLAAYSRAVATKAVAQHADEWAAWNALLPENERFEIPEPPDSIPARPAELGLSEAQMEAMAAVLSRAATPGFIMQLFWRSRLRPALGRVARALGLRK